MNVEKVKGTEQTHEEKHQEDAGGASSTTKDTGKVKTEDAGGHQVEREHSESTTTRSKP